MRISALEARFEGRFTALDGRITAVRAELVERIEGTETRLLKEFRKWAVRIEAVGSINATRSIGLDQRIAVIEERLNDPLLQSAVNCLPSEKTWGVVGPEQCSLNNLTRTPDECCY